jgi:hypothetical protein
MRLCAPSLGVTRGYQGDSLVVEATGGGLLRRLRLVLGLLTLSKGTPVLPAQLDLAVAF